MRFFDKKQSNKFSQLISCRVQTATKLHISTSFSFTFANCLAKQNTVGINTEDFIDLLTTNVNSYFICCSLLMMTFSVSTVDCSEFIFFRGKQIILHSLAIDSTLDARVQNKRILQDNLCTFFFFFN